MPGVMLKTSVAFYGFDARKGDFLLLSFVFPFLPSFSSPTSQLTNPNIFE